MKKHVIVFSLAYLPFVGGAEIAVREISKRLQDEYDFSIITLRFDSKLPKVERLGNVTIYRIGFGVSNPSPEDLLIFPLVVNKYLFPFTSCLKAFLINRKKTAHATWSIMASYAGFGAMFFSYLKPNIPMLLTLQEGDPLEDIEKKVKYVKYFFKKIFLRAKIIQTISNYLADFAKKYNSGVSIEIIPNGVPSDLFSKNISAEEIINMKESLDFESDDLVVFSCSRLVRKNGLETLIKSVTLLPNNVKCIIAGKGPLYSKLNDLILSLGLEGRVKLVGEIPYEKLPLYYQMSDVFVRTSVSEGLGNVFLEAMASKTPVVGTKIGGIPDIILDKKTGLLCAVNDEDDCAHKINILLRDVELRKELIDQAYSMVIEKYDWKIITERMKKIFDKITGQC